MTPKALLADVTLDNVVDKLADLFKAIAETSYLDEPITIAEHMLQSAACAKSDGAAALLHDVGYYVDPLPDNANETDQHKRHDKAAARLLSPVLPAAVAEPIRLHVDAKRYLCAVEPAYYDKLSEASKHTMRLQGGVMDEATTIAFADEAFGPDAVKLRRWDDEGKRPDTVVPGFQAYRAMLRDLVEEQVQKAEPPLLVQ